MKGLNMQVNNVKRMRNYNNPKLLGKNFILNKSKSFIHSFQKTNKIKVLLKHQSKIENSQCGINF